MSFTVANFYKFTPLSGDILIPLKIELRQKAQEYKIKGLFLLGIEGINATISGTAENIQSYKNFLTSKFGEILFKDNICHYIPFKNFLVKIRNEIVTLNNPHIVPKEQKHKHLSPREWDNTLKNERDVTVIDTRNWYETDIGKFKNALTLPINEFSEFPAKMNEMNIDKEKKVLIYCTGGIRCEKAIYDMEQKGYKNVFQLDGGILKYLEQFPNQEFEGECFVFDRRCAIDQNLLPTKNYVFCAHCGQPAAKNIKCVRCDNTAKICVKCLNLGTEYSTCSKNCFHHFVKGSQIHKQKQSLTRQQMHESIIK